MRTSLCGGNVCQYDIDPGTGALSPKTPASVAADPREARSIAVAPDGESAYVLGSSISQYDIDPASGALSPKDPASVAAGTSGDRIVVSPDGKSAYVSNTFPDGISQYSIDPASGVLSPKGPAAGAASSWGRRIVVSPDGKSAYTIMGGGISAEVAQYDIDPVTGGLSPKTPATVSVTQPFQVGSTYATDLAVSPDGKSAVCASLRVSRRTARFRSSTSTRRAGCCRRRPQPVVATADKSARIAFSPDGTSAYITISATWDDPGGVSQFNVDPQSGTLSPKTPRNFSTEPAWDIAVGPLPRFPAAKEHCERGRWRDFPQFKNQGQCVAFAVHGK